VIAVELVRGAWGACELLMPARLAKLALGRAGDGTEHLVIRVLGGRHVAQAALTARAEPAVHMLGGVVDLTHSASMVLLALVDRKRRRAAATSAAVALAFGVTEIVGALLTHDVHARSEHVGNAE
jgi:hypothetical protein